MGFKSRKTKTIRLPENFDALDRIDELNEKLIEALDDFIDHNWEPEQLEAIAKILGAHDFRELVAKEIDSFTDEIVEQVQRVLANSKVVYEDDEDE